MTSYTTTTIKKAAKMTTQPVVRNILVISRQIPLLLDQSGKKISKFAMKKRYPNNIFGQVGIIFQGEFWILGGTTGYNGVNTILKVSNCEVRAVGKLMRDNKELKFAYGRGTVQNDQTIYLCFSYWWNQNCLKSNHPTKPFKLIEDKSLYKHRFGAIASSNGKHKKCYLLNHDLKFCFKHIS